MKTSECSSVHAIHLLFWWSFGQQTVSRSPGGRLLLMCKKARSCGASCGASSGSCTCEIHLVLSQALFVMATLSSFGLGAKLKSEQLMSRLICNILKVQVPLQLIELGNGHCTKMADLLLLLALQPGNDKYELAMDSALQHLQFHQFGDPNPSEVEQNYQG